MHGLRRRLLSSAYDVRAVRAPLASRAKCVLEAERYVSAERTVRQFGGGSVVTRIVSQVAESLV